MNPVDFAEKLIRQGGHVHLLGIGGIGMAGIAILLHERGFEVSGCDLQENEQTNQLKRRGITVLLGHDKAHIDSSVNWLIRSTAVLDSHLEVQTAEAIGIPVSRRGEVLPALLRDRVSIAVTGTHGKTTTTAMIAQILDQGYFVGGEVQGLGGVARDGELMVVEADESDGTIVGYSPDYAVITNIEFDHMEHHASESDFVGCFETLIKNTKQKVFYCADDPIAKKVCAENPKCEPFFYPQVPIKVPMIGRHNQWNASAARAVSKVWKSEAEIFQRLEKLGQIARRFETVLKKDGIWVVSDYAHHPTEVAAVIKMARELNPTRILMVFQPHRYTRTLALGKDFATSFQGVDKLWLVPVYAASEALLEGGTTEDLMTHFSNHWKNRLCFFSTLEGAWKNVLEELMAGDLLLIVGAGDVEQMAAWAKLL